MRYLVGSLVGVAVMVVLFAAGFEADESSAVEVEDHRVCETYGAAVDDIREERFPRSRDPVLLAKETGGVPPMRHLADARVPDLDWECHDRRLTVAIRGPWTLGAADMESALGVLLGDFRNRELDPVMDGVVIVLESVLMDESARFDGAQAERELIESLAGEAELREQSVLDTYDYGPFPASWKLR